MSKRIYLKQKNKVEKQESSTDIQQENKIKFKKTNKKTDFWNRVAAENRRRKILNQNNKKKKRKEKRNWERDAEESIVEEQSQRENDENIILNLRQDKEKILNLLAEIYVENNMIRLMGGSILN